MKRRFLGLVFIFASFTCFAFEAGGRLSTGVSFDIFKSTNPKNTVTTLKNNESISLWAKQNIDKAGNYKFSIQGSYFFNLKKNLNTKTSKPDISNILDLDMLKFSFIFFPKRNNNLSINAGRYGLSDNTRTVFDQTIDGISIMYEQVHFLCLFNIGYTGLLNAYTTPISGVKFAPKNKIYALAPSFIQSSAFFHIPIAKFKHSIEFEFINFTQPKSKGLSKTYMTFSSNGAIIPNLFFILSATGQLSLNDGKYNLGLFLNADLAYYFSSYNAKFGMVLQWFSGGKHQFDTFTLTSASKIALIQHSNLWKTSFYSSLKPLKNLSIGMELNIFADGKKMQNGTLYRGIEFAGALNYTFMKDILFGLDLGVLHQKNSGVKTYIGLRGIISF